jgi:2'-5' RNA ligase
MRAFIALPVTADLRKACLQTQRLLQKKGVRGRFSPPENLHVTLCFLGEVKDPAPVIEALRQTPLPKTALIFDRLTLFGDVTVALLRRNETLETYVKALRQALDAAGITYDRQAFRPHITLARKTALPCPDFKLYLCARPLQKAKLPVKTVKLMKSDLSGSTPKYAVAFSK